MSETLSYFERLRRIKLGELPKESGPKPRKPIKKVSDKRKAEQKADKEELKGGDSELQKWYAKIMQDETPKCWETGEWINKQDKMGWHGSIAHILDKKNFPSVKVHPLNYMILKMWGGTHGQYDSSWENAAKMKVWPYALKVINVLYPLLTAEERRKLPDVIIQEIQPEKYLASK
jgi:hypothetical protein